MGKKEKKQKEKTKGRRKKREKKNNFMKVADKMRAGTCRGLWAHTHTLIHTQTHTRVTYTHT